MATTPTSKETPMSMTRQDFERIARVIREEVPEEARRRTAEAFADELAHTNPRFQRERFLGACLNPRHDQRLDNREVGSPPRGLYDLPIFGWAWEGDGRDLNA